MKSLLFLLVLAASICNCPGQLAAGQREAGDRLLILTMESKDTRNPRGRLRFVANRIEPIGEVTAPPKGIKRVIGVFPIAGGGFELFGWEGKADSEQTLYCYTTSDFATYSEPRKVLVFPADLKWLSAKTMARRDDTGEYLMIAWSRSSPGHGAHAFVSKDGLQWRRLGNGKPVYTDHDAGGMFFSAAARQYVYTQATYQNWKKRYPDNIGGGIRRVLHIRTSPDGLNWKPAENVGFGGPHRPAAELCVPDDQDPDDLEFYQLHGFPYGDRYVGTMLLYVPSPQAVNPNRKRGTPGYYPTRKPSKHGPHLAVEWWVAGAPTDIHDWRRPYREQDAAPPGVIIFHAPVVFGDRLLWFTELGSYGVPLHRIAGVYGRANCEFSTRKFVMPKRPMHLNAAAAWHGDKSNSTQRQAYIMVELLDENDRPIPGYEKEKCIFQDKDDLRLPLRWEGNDATALTGRTVSLRLYFRDATIYAIEDEKRDAALFH